MTTIYLIRHAEAEGNLYRRIHGQYDSLVTVRGKKQLAQLEKRFSGVFLDYIYSSDLFRARATAAAVAANKGLTVMLSEQLREVAMGAWEDRTWGEVERFEPKQLEWFNNDPLLWQVEGSEDFDRLRRRLTHTLNDIAERHDGKTVAVISHGSAIRAFMSGVMDVPPQEIKRVPHCDNTAVARLRFDGGAFGVDYFGDNTHLPEELSTFAHQKWWRDNTTYDSSNLRFVPFDLSDDAGSYLAFRRDASDSIDSEASHNDAIWLEAARSRAAKHPRAVSLALIFDTPAGVLDLDIDSGADENVGVIEFFYMISDQRHTGIAVQLLGQAVSVYRSLGREKIRMSVSARNEQTLGFCAKYGFERTGEYNGEAGRHIILELDIAVP